MTEIAHHPACGCCGAPLPAGMMLIEDAIAALALFDEAIVRCQECLARGEPFDPDDMELLTAFIGYMAAKKLKVN
jgi:hypothetical protein